VEDRQRELGRRPPSFYAWVAIAVGLLVVIVLGSHLPVYLTYRHEQRIIAEVERLGGRADMEVFAPPWPASVIAGRWKPYGRIFNRAFIVYLAKDATDADVALLAGLRKLWELDLCGRPVTDAGVADLKRALPNLKVYR
jgi:hypothetical protein